MDVTYTVVVVGPDCNCYFCMGVYDQGWLPCFSEVYTNSYDIVITNGNVEEIG